MPKLTQPKIERNRERRGRKAIRTDRGADLAHLTCPDCDRRHCDCDRQIQESFDLLELVRRAAEAWW